MTKAESGFSSSHADIERQVIEIWKEVLKCSDPSVERQFLDLGGDSLDAMLCISRIRATFGVRLFVEDFFMDESSISEFAKFISDAKGACLSEDASS